MSRTEFVETIAGFSGRAFRKWRKRKPKAASQERDEGRPKQRYKVRCALTYAFYMDVVAHNSDEAELVAEQYCREEVAGILEPLRHRKVRCVSCGTSEDPISPNDKLPTMWVDLEE